MLRAEILRQEARIAALTCYNMLGAGVSACFGSKIGRLSMIFALSRLEILQNMGSGHRFGYWGLAEEDHHLDLPGLLQRLGRLLSCCGGLVGTLVVRRSLQQACYS